MLCALIATVIICLLQQGVGQDISSLSVCVNLESNYLLVEWKPPFPDNADTLDVHCSSLNDTFVNSFTVRLSSEIANTIAVQVPVHGGGVHLGYIYVIQATLQTTDGIQIHSDPITVGMYMYVCMCLLMCIMYCTTIGFAFAKKFVLYIRYNYCKFSPS